MRKSQTYQQRNNMGHKADTSKILYPKSYLCPCCMMRPNNELKIMYRRITRRKLTQHFLTRLSQLD